MDSFSGWNSSILVVAATAMITNYQVRESSLPKYVMYSLRGHRIILDNNSTDCTLKYILNIKTIAGAKTGGTMINTILASAQTTSQWSSPQLMQHKSCIPSRAYREKRACNAILSVKTSKSLLLLRIALSVINYCYGIRRVNGI